MEKQETVIIKLLDNPENPKLKMKYVGAKEYATPKLGADGKIRTGLDELSVDITRIQDPAARKAKQASIKKEREELEKLLGVDLAPNSDFWNNYFVILSDEEITLDPSNAADRVKERFLVANRYVAPSEEDILTDEDFQNCIFYLYRDVEETSRRATKQKDIDKAIAKLYTLQEDNPNKLKTIASYIFGYNANTDVSVDHAYDKLSDFVKTKDDKAQKANIKRFLEANDKTIEEMQTKLILDRAVSKGIVKARGGIYRRGDIILGNTYEETIENLASVEMANELLSLKKQVKN